MIGISRLARAPLVIQQALSVQEFATFLWNNVGTPNLALSHPGRLSKEAADPIAESWRQTHIGPANARRLMIVEEGMKPEAISATAEDSEVLASRKFACEEIARLYGVPPPWSGSGTIQFRELAAATVWFGVNSRQPWRGPSKRVRQIDFPRSDWFHLEIDLSQLLRGDFATACAGQHLPAARRGDNRQRARAPRSVTTHSPAVTS